MIKIKRHCDLVNFEVTWSARRLKISLHETMITGGCIMAATAMMIVVERNVIH